MAERSPLLVNFTQFGDLVFFKASGKVISCDQTRTLTLQLVPEDEVLSPLQITFRVESSQETRSSHQCRNDPLKPGSHFFLRHVLTGSYLTLTPKATDFLLVFSPVPEAVFFLSPYDQQAHLQDSVRHLDTVSLTSIVLGTEYFLSEDLTFKGKSNARFQVLKFESSSNDTQVRYGHLCKLYANNHMFLGVKPNYENAEKLLEESENYLEYQGELKIDLTTKSEDGNNIWVIEKKERLEGGVLRFEDEFFLWHLGSGRYLGKELRLVTRTEAAWCSFAFFSDAKEAIRLEESNSLRVDSQLLVLGEVPTLQSLWTGLFQPMAQHLDSNSSMRHHLTTNHTGVWKASLKFEVREIDMQVAQQLLAIASLRQGLTSMGITLQRIILHPDQVAQAPVYQLPDLQDTNSIANFASDICVTSQLFRIAVFQSRLKLRDDTSIRIWEKTLSLMSKSATASQCIVENKAMLSAMINISPLAVADLLSHVVFTLVKLCDLTFLAGVYCELRLRCQDLKELNVLLRFYSVLIENHAMATSELVQYQTESGEFDFILKFRKVEDRIQTIVLGTVLEPYQILEPDIAALVNSCLHIAASVCSTRKEEVICQMGLQTDILLQLYLTGNDCLKLALLYFLAEVSVTGSCKSLSDCMSSKLVDRKDLEGREDWRSWFGCDSPALNELVKQELHFWIEANHSSCSEEIWNLASAHVHLVVQLINWNLVSDIFVVSLLYCVIDAANTLLQPYPAASRFPTLSKDEDNAIRTKFLAETIHILSMYQNWKKFQILKTLIQTGVNQVSSNLIQSCISKISPKSTLLDFNSCTPQSLDPDPQKQHLLLTFSPVVDSTRYLTALISDQRNSPEFFLERLISASIPGITDDPTLLSLMDFDLDPVASISAVLAEVVDESGYKQVSDYLLSLEKISVNSYELASKAAVINFPEYVQALYQLDEFMRNLSTDSLLPVQELLSRAQFLPELHRMWTYFSITKDMEGSLYSQFQALTLSITRHFLHCNELFWKELVLILHPDTFLVACPEYLRLLQELRILHEGNEVMGSVFQYLFSVSLKREDSDAVEAMGVLMEYETVRSFCVSIVNEHFSALEHEPTDQEYLILDVLNSAVFRNTKISLFSPIAEKWLESSNNIHLISLALTSPDTFETAVRKAVPLLEKLNKETSESISACFDSWKQVNSNRRNRDFKYYIVELLWKPRLGLIDLLPVFQDQLVPELNEKVVCLLAELCWKLTDTGALTHLQTTLKACKAPTSLGSEEKAYIESTSCRFFPDSPSETSITIAIPPLSPMFFPPLIPKGDRPVVKFYGNNCKSDFQLLKRVFLTKNSTLSYLFACKIATDHINPSEFAHFLPLAQEFLSLCLETANKKVKSLALHILTSMVNQLPQVRDFFLLCLKENHRFLAFFSMFDISLRDRKKRMLNLRLLKSDVDKDLWRKKTQDSRILISSFLKLFQACCDGCIASFQHFLRTQDNALNSFNIVELTSLLLSDTLKCVNVSLDKEELDLALQSSVTLLEMSSGPCRDNQLHICEKSTLLQAIISTMQKAQDSSGISRDLQHSLIKLMTALVEGRECNRKALFELWGNTDVSVFLTLALNYSAELSDADLTALNFETCENPDVKKTFNIALDCIKFCFMTLEDAALEVFRGNKLMQYLSSIEIETGHKAQRREIRSLFFIIPFKAKFITGKTARSLLFTAERSSREEKLHDFSRTVEVSYIEMVYQQALSRHKILKSVSKRWKSYQLLSFVLVTSINIVFLTQVREDGNTRFSLVWEWYYIARVLGLLQSVLITLSTVSYYVEYAHTLYYPVKRNSSLEQFNLSTEADPGALSLFYSAKRPAKKLTIVKEEVWRAVYSISYLLCCWTAIWYPSLYPVLLIQVVSLNEAIVNILNAITKRWSQLLLTFLFTLVSIYMFAFVAYFHLFDYYNPDSGLYCATLWDCFISTLDYGLRADGGLGDALGPSKSIDFFFRLVFDLSFYIFVTTILMAMVFGIIVDSFSELRDELTAVEWDMTNICFICGKKRSVIELKGEGWFRHLLRVHNAYGYLYFIVHLKEMDEKDCSGIEKVVKKLYEEKEISFFPTTSAKLGFSQGGNKEDKE